MVAWGTGILQEDTVVDLIEEFKDYLKDGVTVELASQKLIEKNTEIIEDEDDGPLFWIALAKCQWEYGEIDKEVLHHVVHDYENENGLNRWKEESDKDYLNRKIIIRKFLEKIEKPNSKIKKAPKYIKRKPVFEIGDCLLVRVSENSYGAAIVTQTIGDDTEYPACLIVKLFYNECRKPSIEDFNRLDICVYKSGYFEGLVDASWYGNSGFRKYKDQIVKVGNIDVIKYGEIESKVHSVWAMLLKEISEENYNPINLRKYLKKRTTPNTAPAQGLWALVKKYLPHKHIPSA